MALPLSVAILLLLLPLLLLHSVSSTKLLLSGKQKQSHLGAVFSQGLRTTIPISPGYTGPMDPLLLADEDEAVKSAVGGISPYSTTYAAITAGSKTDSKAGRAKTAGMAQPAAQTLDQQLNHCRVKYATLNGMAQSTSLDSNNEAVCFFFCANTNTPWYSWNQTANLCQCFFRDNITTIMSATGTNPPYSVYGKIRLCPNFCSVRVPNCQRCNTKLGGFLCLPIDRAYPTTRRCCCYPPRKFFIRNGLLTGCTKVTRPQ